MGPNPNVVRDGVVQKEFVINAQDPKAMKTVNTDRKYTQVGTEARGGGEKKKVPGKGQIVIAETSAAPILSLSLSPLAVLQFFLSTSASVKSSMVIGPPVVFAPNGIMKPKLSGSLALGGKITAGELADFVLTYNCKHNGTGLVTVQVRRQGNKREGEKTLHTSAHSLARCLIE